MSNGRNVVKGGNSDREERENGERRNWSKGLLARKKEQRREQHGNKVDKVRPVTQDRRNGAREKCLRRWKGVVRKN